MELWNLKQNPLGLWNESPRQNIRPKNKKQNFFRQKGPNPGGRKPRPGQKSPSQPILPERGKVNLLARTTKAEEKTPARKRIWKA